MTTLHDFGGVLGRPLDTFFWALTISWSRLLASWLVCEVILSSNNTPIKFRYQSKRSKQITPTCLNYKFRSHKPWHRVGEISVATLISGYNSESDSDREGLCGKTITNHLSILFLATPCVSVGDQLFFFVFFICKYNGSTLVGSSKGSCL